MYQPLIGFINRGQCESASLFLLAPVPQWICSVCHVDSLTLKWSATGMCLSVRSRLSMCNSPTRLAFCLSRGEYILAGDLCITRRWYSSAPSDVYIYSTQNDRWSFPPHTSPDQVSPVTPTAWGCQPELSLCRHQPQSTMELLQ